MGFKSFLFKHSGSAKRLESALVQAKASQLKLKQRVAELKAQPPRRPLDSQPPHEQALQTALAELKQDQQYLATVPDWPSLADRVGTAVSECDIMLVKGTALAYAQAGLSALACVHQALVATGQPRPARLLDFGCGYGRVLRFLSAAFPDTELFCTDMDGEGLGFCTHHFKTFGFRTDLESGPTWVKARFDLIWVGSVFTHLDIPNSQRLLRHLADFLAPGGLVVFTTHGESAVDRMKRHRPIYRLEPALLDQIVRDCEATGHGYADYPNWPGYGVSATTTAWVDQMIQATGLTRRLHLPAGWAAHQEVFVAQA